MSDPKAQGGRKKTSPGRAVPATVVLPSNSGEQSTTAEPNLFRLVMRCSSSIATTMATGSCRWNVSAESSFSRKRG